MSYLRPFSNPENLYIYRNQDKVVFNWDATEVAIDNSSFEDIVKKYLTGDYDYRIKNRELNVSFDTKPSLKVRIIFCKSKHTLFVFDVTWSYIVNEYQRRKHISFWERFKYLFKF